MGEPALVYSEAPGFQVFQSIQYTPCLYKLYIYTMLFIASAWKECFNNRIGGEFKEQKKYWILERSGSVFNDLQLKWERHNQRGTDKARDGQRDRKTTWGVEGASLTNEKVFVSLHSPTLLLTTWGSAIQQWVNGLLRQWRTTNGITHSQLQKASQADRGSGKVRQGSFISTAHFKHEGNSKCFT